MENRRKRLEVKRVKWLQELKQKENIAILPKFKERYIKSCYKVALRRYYKKDKPIMLTIIY